MAKNGRMLSHEIDNVIAKQKQRLDLKKAQKLRREEKLKKEIAKTEAQLNKLKASDWFYKGFHYCLIRAVII
mgnify:CR=1 FL=1